MAIVNEVVRGDSNLAGSGRNVDSSGHCLTLARGAESPETILKMKFGKKTHPKLRR
jgi:hypothetical protein